MEIKVCASILSANFLKLGKELKRAEDAGCDYIHIDVMDGNYVDTLGVGLCIAQWLPKGTSLRLDAHLAVSHPMDFVDAFADAGMNTLLFQPDTCPHHFQLMERIKKRGMLAGVVLMQSAPVDTIRCLLPDIDVVDQMAVGIGYPSQVYRKSVNENLTELKRLKQEHGYAYEIQVDGGIDETTAKMAIDAGAEVLVSGSTLFESEDMAAVVQSFKQYDLNQR